MITYLLFRKLKKVCDHHKFDYELKYKMENYRRIYALSVEVNDLTTVVTVGEKLSDVIISSFYQLAEWI